MLPFLGLVERTAADRFSGGRLLMTNICTNEPALGSIRFRRLSEAQCQKIFFACLELLERTGVRLYHQPAIDLLKKAGTSICDGNQVRIPAGLVQKALTTAPRRVTLFNRYGERVMPVEGYRAFFGPGSDCLNVIDHRTGERRPATLPDIEEAMIVADSLPNIDFVMCMFLPEDVPQAVVDRYQMEAMLNYSAKPIIFVTTDFSGCVDAIEMAEAVVGGAEALRRCPLVVPGPVRGPGGLGTFAA
jgi:trimethylamine--corrinoid protein Co-methyltransferase